MIPAALIKVLLLQFVLVLGRNLFIKSYAAQAVPLYSTLQPIYRQEFLQSAPSLEARMSISSALISALTLLLFQSSLALTLAIYSQGPPAPV
jgi:hypothetical protein